MADSNRTGLTLPCVIWTSADGRYRIVVTNVAQGTADFVYEKLTGSDAMLCPQWSRFDFGADCNVVEMTRLIAYEQLEKKYPTWRAWLP
jgi:hypothetical protein